MEEFPIDLGSDELNKKIVYSPHVYGPDAFVQPYFGAKNFPKNMPAIWKSQWAFVEGQTDRAVVVGEWGGHYEKQDKVWQDAFAKFILDECLEDTFYWCLNPNRYERVVGRGREGGREGGRKGRMRRLLSHLLLLKKIWAFTDSFSHFLYT